MERHAATLGQGPGLEMWRAFVRSVNQSFETQAGLLPIVALGLLGAALVALDVAVYRWLRRRARRR